MSHFLPLQGNSKMERKTYRCDISNQEKKIGTNTKNKAKKIESNKKKVQT